MKARDKKKIIDAFDKIDQATVDIAGTLDTVKALIYKNTKSPEEEEWEEYKGKYEKEEYMVKTEDGEVHGPCWPNAGMFYPLDGSGAIDGEEVVMARKARDGGSGYPGRERIHEEGDG